MFQFPKKLVLFLSLLLPYSVAQSSSLCGSCCTSYSNETMDLDQVISPPRKSWCCCSQPYLPYLPDFEESLHLLDRSLGNTGWIKAPIIENDKFFRLVGFRYQQGNNWIAIIQEYGNTEVKRYKLNSTLMEQSNYVLERWVEKMRSHIREVTGTKKKYFCLTEKGLEIVNEPEYKPFSTLLEAGGKANILSKDFVDGLLPIPLSGLITEGPQKMRLRQRLEKILGSWKFEGVTIEIDIDKQNVYLQAQPPFTRSERISVYFHNGNVAAGSSDRGEDTTSSSSVALSAGEKDKR